MYITDKWRDDFDWREYKIPGKDYKEDIEESLDFYIILDHNEKPIPKPKRPFGFNKE